jgi:hypothetical protein
MPVYKMRSYANASTDINEVIRIDPTNPKILGARSTIQALALRSGIYDD